jgi:hypothetical protein
MGVYLLSYPVRDSKGDKNSFVCTIPDTELLADVLDFGTSLHTLLDNVTEGLVGQGSLTIPIPVGASLKTEAIAASDVQKGALYTFSVTGSNYATSLRVPAVIEEHATGEEINQTITEQEAFIEAFTVGLTENGNLVRPSDRYENVIAAVTSAVLSFRRK